MKNNYLFLTILLVTISTFGQTKYHRLGKLGNDINIATNNYCQDNTIGQLKLNITSIPSRLSTGTVVNIDAGESFDGFYIVEYSKNSSDQDADENVSFSDLSITTLGCIDLKAKSLFHLTNGTPRPGSARRITSNVQNIGSATSNSYERKFYLSVDGSLSSNDVLLKTESFSPQPSGGNFLVASDIIIPENTEEGTYYIIMSVITSLDVNLSNNIISSISFLIEEEQQTPPADSDNDGIPDSSDNCPNEAGPASNNGCPTSTGNADLIIDSNNSTAKSSGAPGTVQSFSTNVLHRLYLGENLQLKIDVKNIGNTSSDSMKVGIYVTQGSQFSNAFLLTSLNFNGVIQPNNTNTRTTEIPGSIIDGYATSSGNAYIHIFVDKDDDVDEGSSGGENNNVFSSIPVKVFISNR